MKFRSVSSLLLAIASFASAGSLDALHAPWGEILAANVQGERVDYAGVLKDKAKLDGYLQSLAVLDPAAVSSASKDERSALYINAYNAAVFDLILKNPGKGSVAQMPPDVTGPKVVAIAAESLSVGDLLRKKLFENDPDPRFWALVCDGSLGAAPIHNQPYTSDNVRKLAEERTRMWLADTARNKIDDKQTKLAQIPFDFFRFKPEFKNFNGGVAGFVKKYGPSGADPEKNRPTFFYNGAKNSVAVAAPAKPEKGGKGGAKGKKK